MTIEIIEKAPVLGLDINLTNLKTDLENYFQRNPKLKTKILHYSALFLQIPLKACGYYAEIFKDPNSSKEVLIVGNRSQYVNYKHFANSIYLPTTQLELIKWFRGYDC